MKNPDRDQEHRRRRESSTDNDSPDEKAVARALYGGDPSALNEDEEPDEEPMLFTDETADG